METSSTSSANDEYVLTHRNEGGGMCRTDTIFLAPAAVVRCFGDGGHGDTCKVSREYAFRKGDSIFRLYDWKSTDLYDPQLLTFEEFWTLETPTELFVGCNCSATRGDLERFAEWIRKKTLDAKE